MTESYSNLQGCKIIQNANLFTIEFTYPSPVVCHSLVKTRILRGATISDDYKQVIFKPYSVQLYCQEMQAHKSNMAATLAASLGGQLKYMIDVLGHSFLGFNAENIIVIDGDRCAFLDCDLVCKINGDNETIMVNNLFTGCGFFVSPELKVKVLTKKVHYKTAYFSLGCLLLYTLLGKDIFDGIYQEYLLINNNSANNNSAAIFLKHLDLSPYKETKLYWLICRCLVEEPEKRSILFF